MTDPLSSDLLEVLCEVLVVLIRSSSQHVVFFVGRLIDMMVPDIPEEVEMKIKREHYMAKEALAENQVRLLSASVVLVGVTSVFALCLQSLGKIKIPGEKIDVLTAELQRFSSPQRDAPAPDLRESPEDQNQSPATEREDI